MGDASAVASPAAVDYLRLSMVRGLGPVVVGRLLERFGSASAILAASPAQWRSVRGVGSEAADGIAAARSNPDCERELELAAAHGVRILCREDESYPYALRHIPDAPICLYVKGRLEPADAVAVAIVGSRRCTQYGREQARRFGFGLAQRGVTVVSGLARGIDASAHWGAIEAKGRTIAVLGNGLASVYPPEHRELAERISGGCGALLSELPMQTPPDGANFVPRNRIIAGLSLGVLVVEASRRSGALATARHGLEYGREVFALPGRIDSAFSEGTNGMIRDQHAKLVTNIKDVFDELGETGRTLCPDAPLFAEPPTLSPRLLPEEEQVYRRVGREDQTIEQIAARADLPVGQVTAILIALQIKHLVVQRPGGVFVRA